MTRAGVRRIEPIRGTALAAVLVSILLLSALGLSLVLVAMTETLAAGASRDAQRALYAAESGLARAIADLRRMPEWTPVLSGGAVSGFADGSPSGPRTLPDGRTIDLGAVVNRANCGTVTTCSAAVMDDVTGQRPWGRNNPRWRLYAWGPMTALWQGAAAGAAEASAPGREYVVVLVADDPAESDGNPEADAPAGAPGSGVVLVRAEAFGVGAAHRVIEATLARARPEPEGSGYQSQRGQARAGDASTRMAVQTPGGALAHTEWNVGEWRRP